MSTFEQRTGQGGNGKGKRASYRKPAEVKEKITLPHSLEAENGVIGCVLLDNDSLEEVAHILDRAEFFFDPDNHAIWDTITRLIEREGRATPILVSNRLSNSDGVDGKLLDRLNKATRTCKRENLVQYAKDIRRLSEKGTAFEILTAQAAKALDKSTDDDVLQETAKLLEQADAKGDFEFKSYVDFFDEALEHVNNAAMRGDGLLGLSTGLKPLDEMTGGVPPASVTLVGGGTSHGKTVLGMQIAFHNARQGVPVGVFSMEMAGLILAARDIANVTQLEIGDMLRGRVGDAETKAMMSLRDEAKALAIVIDDTSNLKPSQLKSRIKRLIKDKGVKLIVLDYLQLMDSDEWGKDEYQRLGKISPALKHMAKDLKIPILALAQLNRNFDTQKRPPEKQDLRGSGQLEQDAEQIWMVYRPELQMSDAPKDDEEPFNLMASGFSDVLRSKKHVKNAKNALDKDSSAWA